MLINAEIVGNQHNELITVIISVERVGEGYEKVGFILPLNEPFAFLEYTCTILNTF